MKIVLPGIQWNTTKFRINTLEPMILLGGKIANFSKFASDYLRMLSTFINKITESSVKSPQYNKEKKGAATVLKGLKDHAGKDQAECTKTVLELGAVGYPKRSRQVNVWQLTSALMDSSKCSP